ncbi:MAG TPA: energy transducer TonB [Xanthobacteraceae bacterium]|nr:energy transducer TonB [Xanthobacteraceae bacterium]
MTARTLVWYEDDTSRDWLRWSIAAGFVVCVHAALIGGYMLWHQPDDDAVGDEISVISVEFTVPETEQQEQAKVEEQQPPPPVTADSIPLPEEKPPEKVEPTNPAPRTTAHTEAAAPRIDPSWQTLLLKRLQQFKNYPSAARSRGEQGVVLLAFSIDRDGHVVARHIINSSGYADLDQEVMTMVERAQPLPAFPASMAQAQLDLTVPIRFSLR